MEPPSAIYLECPSCGRAPHRVIRGRLSRRREIVLEGLVRCLRCGYTRRETYREWAPRELPIIVSYKGSAHRARVEIMPPELVRVGDRMEVEGNRVEITAIESKGRRLEEAPASEVDVLWSKRVDRVPVKFSLNKGRETLSFTLEALPDEEFEVGEVVDLGRERGVIHRLKTKRGLLREGAARAEEITRVYCKAVRLPRRERRPRGPRR